jgi:hypothetical protein
LCGIIGNKHPPASTCTPIQQHTPFSAKPPFHVAFPAGIAVLGGALASKYISEKTINITGGALFLLFAGATAFSLL